MVKRFVSMIAVLSITAMLFGNFITPANAQPVARPNRVVFTQAIDTVNPRIGDVITVTLTFATSEYENEAIEVKVVNANPAPTYLQIVQGTIEGGASYGSSVGAGGPEGVIWTGTLQPGGTLPVVVTFQMRVKGIPKNALATGYSILNLAQISDSGTGSLGGSLPIQNAEASFTAWPFRSLFPRVFR